MGTKRKAVKGTVSLQVLTNRRRFKYRYQKQVFFLTLQRIPSPFKEYIRKIIQVDLIQVTYPIVKDKKVRYYFNCVLSLCS